MTTQDRGVTLQSNAPVEFYDLAVDLINSIEIYLFNPQGVDESSRWERVTLDGTNKVEKNTVARRIEFELNINLPNYITREI